MEVLINSIFNNNNDDDDSKIIKIIIIIIIIHNHELGYESRYPHLISITLHEYLPVFKYLNAKPTVNMTEGGSHKAVCRS